MISEIEFAKVSQSKLFEYAAAVDFFKKNTSIKFTPGLNILFGPNGCGKSTILRMAALTLAAEQGGVSTITHTWLNEVTRRNESQLKGVEVFHDGQPLMYGNPRNAIGLFGGGAAFDDDFLTEGLANIQSKASTGLTTLNRMHQMLIVAKEDSGFPLTIDNREPSAEKHFEAAFALLKARIPKGHRTLIFDEPESGLAIPVQHNVFNLLYAAARKHNFQILVATHSAFALGLPETNYIEMAPGYLEQSEEALSSVHLRLEFNRVIKQTKLNVSETASSRKPKKFKVPT